MRAGRFRDDLTSFQVQLRNDLSYHRTSIGYNNVSGPEQESPIRSSLLNSGVGRRNDVVLNILVHYLESSL